MDLTKIFIIKKIFVIYGKLIYKKSIVQQLLQVKTMDQKQFYYEVL
jgi:hypothetical protein